MHLRVNADTFGGVTEPTPTRAYRSPLRDRQSRQTRQSILRAAQRRFTEHGYAATTVAQIAEEAGVAVDTVYASVGTKPLLFREMMEAAISGAAGAVPPEQRDYVQRMRAEPSARQKLRIYAGAVRAIAERSAPLHLVLRDAAAQAPELARVRDEIAGRRARNMRLLAQDLLDSGQLRRGLGVEEIADVVWTMNSAEFYDLLVRERGWPPQRFEEWLADTWCRLFLDADEGD